MTDERKKRLRTDMLKRLRTHYAPSRKKKNDGICNLVTSAREFKKAKTVMFYVSLDWEVGTELMIKAALRAKKQIVVPLVHRAKKTLLPVRIHDPNRDLAEGSYGILEPRPDLIEPFDVEKIDLVLVPGLAFDPDGFRLGRGAGYYDRFLKTLPPRTLKVGVAFDFQIVDQVPRQAWDQPVHVLVTNG
jgi:5-formyltetrahydrofolate cyclo-ligase